jgi:hypothetical protein
MPLLLRDNDRTDGVCDTEHVEQLFDQHGTNIKNYGLEFGRAFLDYRNLDHGGLKQGRC